MAVNSSVMSWSIRTMPWLPNMQDQKSLTLHWQWFSEWGRERVDIVFASQGGQYFFYGCLQPIATWITPDTKLKIIDAPLMLHWGSFSEWGSDCVAFSVAYKGCHYFGYAWQRPNHCSITFLRRPKFIGALLTLIFRLGQWLCWFHSYC